MGIEVCELRRKFQLLKSYGVITSLNEIADKVGRKENTLWGWADGNATTEANQVPTRNFEAFRIAFVEVLKDHVSRERSEALIFAPASHLENELRRTKGPKKPNLLELIEAEADTTAIKLIRLADEQKTERGLIETQLDQQPKGPVHQVKQGEWFRLVVERDFSTFNIIALQHGGALWGEVPWSIESGSGHLHLPGVKNDGASAYMREVNAPGPNTFVVLGTKTPLPFTAKSSAPEGRVVDQRSLETLSQQYSKHSISQRWLMTCDVRVE